MFTHHGYLGICTFQRAGTAYKKETAGPEHTEKRIATCIYTDKAGNKNTSQGRPAVYPGEETIEILFLFGNETVDFVDYVMDPENEASQKRNLPEQGFS